MIHKDDLIREDLIKKLKSSEDYLSFHKILEEKIANETKAKTILIQNDGKLNCDHFKMIFPLIDKSYLKNGNINKGPWFGRLLGCNTGSMLKLDEDKINKWFYILMNKQLSIVQKMDILQSKEFKIKGLNVGFITLMHYILEKQSYQIWFRGQHDGLKLIYPEFQKFNGKSKQYIVFNEAAKRFADQYHFEPEELDWVFSTGLPVICGSKKNRQVELK